MVYRIYKIQVMWLKKAWFSDKSKSKCRFLYYLYADLLELQADKESPEQWYLSFIARIMELPFSVIQWNRVALYLWYCKFSKWSLRLLTEVLYLTKWHPGNNPTIRVSTYPAIILKCIFPLIFIPSRQCTHSLLCCRTAPNLKLPFSFAKEKMDWEWNRKYSA